MPQLSKLLQSRENWKNKATLRATENRERRKQTKFHQKKIVELKAELKKHEFEHSLPDKKNTTNYSTNHKQ